MNRKTLFLLANLFCLNLFSQTLSITETLDYINSNLQKGSAERYLVKLESNGKLIVDVLRPHPAYKNKYEKSVSQEAYANEIQVEKFNSSVEGKVLRITCKEKTKRFGMEMSTNCINLIWSSRSMASYDITIKTFGKDNLDKMFNAFSYLLSEIENSDEYSTDDDDDPFANKNLGKSKPTISGIDSKDNIPLETYGGIYKVWVKIGNLKKHFVLDSGASEISLSKETERQLIDNGTIKREDYIEPALFKLADGSIIKCRRLIIPEMTIGNYTIKNVRASIGVSESPLLLGRSFLDNFKKWSIDNQNKELILEK